MEDKTKARVTGYISDVFTTEDHLRDSVGMVGVTATNIAVTPLMVFYKGGVYYNPEECVDSEEELVPEECREERAGRVSYTCLNKVTISSHLTFIKLTLQDGVNCAELIPAHCDIFFRQSNTSLAHSVTVEGYGEDEEGNQFWRLKNSWGSDWGEGGYMRIARGLGHCNVGSIFSVPLCQ